MPAAWWAEEEADELPDPADGRGRQETQDDLEQATEAEEASVPPDRQFRDSMLVPGTDGRMHRDVMAEEVRLWMENKEVMWHSC